MRWIAFTFLLALSAMTIISQGASTRTTKTTKPNKRKVVENEPVAEESIRRDYRKSFALADRDGDRLVSLDEGRAELEAIDLNHDSKISYPEFSRFGLTGLNEYNEPGLRSFYGTYLDEDGDQVADFEQFRRTFKESDKNKDGKLDFGELFHRDFGFKPRRSPTKEENKQALKNDFLKAFAIFDANANNAVDRGEALRRIQLIDNDHDGKVSRGEFKHFGAESFDDIYDTRLDYAFNSIDVNGDNKLTYIDLKKKFIDRDTNKDGEVDFFEYFGRKRPRFVKHTPQEDKIAREHDYRKAFALFDDNFSNRLSLDEARAHFLKLDRNRDGKLSLLEVRRFGLKDVGENDDYRIQNYFHGFGDANDRDVPIDQIVKYYRARDVDKDGALEFNEFI